MINVLLYRFYCCMICFVLIINCLLSFIIIQGKFTSLPFLKFTGGEHANKEQPKPLKIENKLKDSEKNDFVFASLEFGQL